MWADIAGALPAALAAPFESIDAMFRAGGPVLPWIFVSALVLWYLIAERWWFHRRVLPRRLASIEAEWQGRETRRSWTALRIRRQMISETVSAMEAGTSLMRVLIPLTPLLGLLGTVSGMLDAFEVMAISGSVDARTMAYGVSHAMVCTLASLGVAVSGLFFVRHFRHRTQRQKQWLLRRLVIAE